jgi:5-methyltetrahydrofolate--homocysteine methyltransferase
MSRFKEDVNDAKERLKAWWDHEIIDRPVISYYYPREGSTAGAGIINVFGFSWDLARSPDDIEQMLTSFEENLPELYFGGESIPSFFPNYGAGIMAAVFGVIPKYQTRTIWFSRPTPVEDIVSLLENVKLNNNNPWYARLLHITEYAAKRSQGNYQISITDLGGILDILSSFLGPNNIILTMKRRPDIIDTCREIILEKTLKVYDDLQNIIDKYNDGCNAWLNVWNKKRWYPIQCDFSAMLNPKWFKRFALPDIRAQAAHMDYSMYHLDGPLALTHLDDLLSIPELTGIQWVPGDGREPMGHEKWYPIYKKIQNAGKNIVNTVSPTRAIGMYKKFDPRGLYLRVIYLNNHLAQYYLPSFIGGDGGEIIKKAITWGENKGISRMNRKAFEMFLDESKIKIENRNPKKLHQEINRKLKIKSESTLNLS